jgi:hypothetical protein
MHVPPRIPSRDQDKRSRSAIEGHAANSSHTIVRKVPLTCLVFGLLRPLNVVTVHSNELRGGGTPDM